MGRIERIARKGHKTHLLTFDSYADGLHQWFDSSGNYANLERHWLFVERVSSKSSRRKQWCIVDRTDAEWEEGLYPPIVAGPFPNIKAALTAYLVMVGGG